MNIDKLSTSDLSYLEGFVKSCEDKGQDPEKVLAKQADKDPRGGLLAPTLAGLLPFGSTIYGAVKSPDDRVVGAAKGAIGGTLGAVGGGLAGAGLGAGLGAGVAGLLMLLAKHNPKLLISALKGVHGYKDTLALSAVAGGVGGDVMGSAVGGGVGARRAVMGKQEKQAQEQPGIVKRTISGAGKGLMAGAGIGGALGGIGQGIVTSNALSKVHDLNAHKTEALKILLMSILRGVGIGAVNGAQLGASVGGITGAVRQ